MSDFRQIYAQQAEAYDALVMAEDYEGNLKVALDELRPLSSSATYIDVGAGTGRVVNLLHTHYERILVSDGSPHMLSVAQKKLPSETVRIFAADNRALPLPDQTADFITAGWTFGHFTGWYPSRWRDEINQAIDEMLRVLRPGGTAVILETLGTGYELPTPPTSHLARYYHMLRRERGFQHRWLRTDYHYESPEKAADSLRFFFGDSFAAQVIDQRWSIVPECTGMWWKTI